MRRWIEPSLTHVGYWLGYDPDDEMTEEKAKEVDETNLRKLETTKRRLAEEETNCFLPAEGDDVSPDELMPVGNYYD